MEVSRRDLTYRTHEVDLVLSSNELPEFPAVWAPPVTLDIVFMHRVDNLNDLFPVALPLAPYDLPRDIFAFSDSWRWRKPDVLAAQGDPLLLGNLEGHVRLDCAREVNAEVLLDYVPILTEPHHGPLDVACAIEVHV